MHAYRKVAFHTLGCKLNFSETSTIARLFEQGGYARVDFSDHPDVFVINTCSVTDQADKKCRNLVSRALRINPNAFVAVVGCYAQLKPDEITAIPGVDVVLGANEKFNILDHIGASKNATPHSAWTPIKEVKRFVPGFSYGDRTRSFFKVQDGCDYFCAFCTIPLARGRSRSATIAETVAECRKIAATETREIVLTGVNIGDFGTGNNESFLDLIRALDGIEGIDRFRISSIEPNLLTDEIIAFVSCSHKFLPHFHIPLQSGSDVILEKMRRRYRTALYASRIAAIRQHMPNACIGVDVITGFPGETEERFMETVDFLKELDVNYLHVFTYSERDNTTAVRMDEVVPMDVRRERTRKLQILGEKKKRAFYQANLGTTQTVLVEHEVNEDGRLEGFTDNYVRVTLPFNESLKNQLVTVTLRAIDGNGLVTGQLQPVEA
jgi:threonylcarbamoyladenosine tRNA methylthiotransferase MtaB